MVTYVTFYRDGIKQAINSKNAQTNWAIINKHSQHDSSLESGMTNSQKSDDY